MLIKDRVVLMHGRPCETPIKIVGEIGRMKAARGAAHDQGRARHDVTLTATRRIV